MEAHNQQTHSDESPQHLQSLYGSVNIGFENQDCPADSSEIEPIIDRGRRKSSAERTVRFLSTINQSLIKEKSKKSKSFIIKKTNIPKKIFDILILLCALYSVLTSLSYLGFYSPPASQLSFDYFIWACFILDFLLKFVSEARSRGKPIITHREIFVKYARTWMVFDILSLLPLHWAGQPDAEYWLRLFRIFKLRKLFVLIKMEEVIDYVMSKLAFMDHRKAKKLTIIINFGWSLFYQILAMLFASYSLACIWLYYTGIIEENDAELEYFQVEFQLNILSPGAKLVKTWYFIYTTLMTVGYGDLYATNKYEMGFCILLLIIGPTMYAYAMGKSVDTINRLRNVGKDSERINNFEAWLVSIETNYEKLAPKLKTKIIEHFTHYFNHDKASILAEKHWNYAANSEYFHFHNKFLNEIPDQLRFQLLDHLFLEVFYKFKVFFGSADHFRYYVCLHIQPRIFRNRTVIIKEGKVPSEVLFLEIGKVYVGLEDSTGFRSVYKYKNRSILGDYFVINNTPSFARFVVRKQFIGFAIPGRVVIKVGKMFSRQFAEIMRVSDKKAGIIKTNIEDQFHVMNGSHEESKPVRNSVGRKSIGKNSMRKIKGKSGQATAVSKDLGMFKDLPKTISSARRSQGNLLAELGDKMQELIELSRKTND